MSAYKKGFSVKKQQRKNNKLFWGVVAGVVAVLAVTGGWLYWHHRSERGAKTDNTHVTPRPITDKTGKGSDAAAPSSTNNASSTADKTGSSSGSTPTPNPSPQPNVTPAKPYGSFVSNHKPGQNGSPLDEESVCNTTPNITCTITFAKDGVTKQLPPKPTDRAGSAYWSWTPASLQLTSGSWTVTAVATSGQQSSSTTDSLALQVP